MVKDQEVAVKFVRAGPLLDAQSPEPQAVSRHKSQITLAKPWDFSPPPTGLDIAMDDAACPRRRLPLSGCIRVQNRIHSISCILYPAGDLNFVLDTAQHPQTWSEFVGARPPADQIDSQAA